MTARREASIDFACFGSRCTVFVIGPGRLGTAELAVHLVRRQLLEWHRRFSRFEPESELSRLNADPRARVRVSATMARLAQAIAWAAEATGGLVDGTLLREIEAAGYAADMSGSLPLDAALGLAPRRRPASPSARARWRQIKADAEKGTIARPPGLGLDSGGLAKGLFADLIAQLLADHASFAVNCAGDLRVGGAAATPRPVDVTSPFDGTVLRRLELLEAGVATSGIGKRSWLDAGGAPAHHLLDPSTGRPAFTGIVQATAIAPTALVAEALATAAVLTGPGGARCWLPYGGVVVYEDGGHELAEAERRLPGSAQLSPSPG